MQPPARRRARQGRLEPGLLVRRRAPSARLGASSGGGDRLVAPRPGVDQEQLGERPDRARTGTPAPGPTGPGGGSGSHSSRARNAAARRAAHGPSRSGLCSVAPSRHAPSANSWSSTVAMIGWAALIGLHVGVAPVLGVAEPVVVERPALVERLERPADVRARRLARRRRLRGLVDPVAEVEDERAGRGARRAARRR